MTLQEILPYHIYIPPDRFSVSDFLQLSFIDCKYIRRFNFLFAASIAVSPSIFVILPSNYVAKYSTLQILSSDTSMFLAARSLWMNDLLARYAIPEDMC